MVENKLQTLTLFSKDTVSSNKIEIMNNISKIQERIYPKIANLSELMKTLEKNLRELNGIKEDTQKIVDKSFKLDQLSVRSDLNLFIDNPIDLKKNLTNYIKIVGRSNWSDDKKDLWADNIIKIFEYWCEFDKNEWKCILKGLLQITIGKLKAEIGSDLISSGIDKFFDWIKKIQEKHGSK